MFRKLSQRLISYPVSIQTYFGPKRFFAGHLSDLKSLPPQLSTLITPGKVLVFTKEYCPYCENAKEFLDEKGVIYEIIRADKLGITNEQKEQFMALTGGKTFPRIFVGQQSIGGFSELMKLHDKGQLDQIFEKESVEFEN